MKTTHYSRNLDSKGRINIPIRFRQAWELEAGDEFSFYYENDCIIIKKCISKHAGNPADERVSLKNMRYKKE